MHIIFLSVYIAHNLLEHPQNKLVAVITYVIVDINRHEPHVFFPPLRPWKLYRFNSDCYRHQRLLPLMLNKYILACDIYYMLFKKSVYVEHAPYVRAEGDPKRQNWCCYRKCINTLWIERSTALWYDIKYSLCPLLIQTVLQITQKQISL